MKCKLCGEPHSKELLHLNKTQLYKTVAKDLDVVDRSFFDAKELADLAASYIWERIILVKKKAHKTGWFSRAPFTMRYDAHPKPAKLMLPNGLILWMTDRADNQPPGATEYKIRNIIIPLSIEGDCPNCGSKIQLQKLEEKKIKCSSCGKQYKTVVEDREMVWIRNKESPDLEVSIKLIPV